MGVESAQPDRIGILVTRFALLVMVAMVALLLSLIHI